MVDITLCVGINCKVKRYCMRYSLVGSQYQSYMATCKDKKLFMGKKKRKAEKWW